MHELVKDIIGQGQHFISAAEILVQINGNTAFFPAVEPLVFIHKDLRACLTETIDALLNIPHHKHIMPADLFL